MSSKKARGPKMIPLSYTDSSGPRALMWVSVEQVAAVRRHEPGGTAVMLASGITLETDDSLGYVLELMGAAGASFPLAERRPDE